jgi:hypothetical protein
MDKSPSSSEIRTLVLVPAIISLGITLLRLTGELANWSPLLFSRQAGGGGALVGISWLIPIFGIYFAVRLARDGYGPASRGRAVGLAFLGTVVFAGLVAVTFQLGLPPVLGLVLANLGTVAGAAIAYRGWPAFGKTALAYGLAARVPVAIVMLVAILANWGTHYELGPPGFPEMSPIPKWIVIGLIPQMMLWISLTITAGALFGSLAVLFVSPRRTAAA